MDPRLLRYYNQELQHLHEMGAEFAEAFPKIAGRLGMSGIEVADPYVERLLEGFAFLAARVQLRLDAEFPRFTQRLLEMIYPNFLTPTPAMLIACFEPQLAEPGLATGFPIPRDTALRAQPAKSEATGCEFRTADELRLWPLRIIQAEYFQYAPDMPVARFGLRKPMKAGIRIKLQSTAGVTLDQLALDRLRICLSGSDEVAGKLYELIFGSAQAVVLAPGTRPWAWHELLPARCIERVGYGDDEALLPANLRSFQGYRLLQEYFAFPRRYLFFDVTGINPVLRRRGGSEFELVIPFSRHEPGLEAVVDQADFALHCVPAINLFPKRADRIHLDDAVNEHHVVPDRTRPMDFEVFAVTGVTGFGVDSDGDQPFLPFYAAYHTEGTAHRAYYTLLREPRVPSEKQRRTGFRTSYVGSEVYLSLVDPAEAPYRGDLRQLAVSTLCTNRDLPLIMPQGTDRSDFSLDIAAPVDAIRTLKGPSRPASPLALGAVSWRFLSQLSLNYLSLMDAGPEEGAAALREMLSLYVSQPEAGTAKQVEGLLGMSVRPVTRRLPMPGPIAFGRGLEIGLQVSELAFQGGSAYLFGCVLEQLLARHASLNTFTETVLRSAERGEIGRWEPRCGSRPIL
ncbi:type VI secretion system baseplate subunit TssF [Chitinivorax sp. PXF-14]|uniref:type VI secretion system baseplate subunit TssF n=1 Tax=Chitinivorax sp. PXF-14 TaxID=3230488 RepID=UPI0034650EFF